MIPQSPQAHSVSESFTLRFDSGFFENHILNSRSPGSVGSRARTSPSLHLRKYNDMFKIQLWFSITMILIILAPKAGHRARERQRFKRIQAAEALAPGEKYWQSWCFVYFLRPSWRNKSKSQILFFCITCFGHLALITCSFAQQDWNSFELILPSALHRKWKSIQN